MAPSNSYHEANIYMNEFAGDRTYRHSPWTSNPILSALVFIAIGTTLVFYIQARSLTRKMRPSVAGVPVRLPATIVWGLFSLQHSQISHVHAGTVQSDGGVVHFSLGCSPGVQYDVQSFQSLRDADSSALKYQHANASLVLSEVENLGSLQQVLHSSAVYMRAPLSWSSPLYSPLSSPLSFRSSERINICHSWQIFIHELFVISIWLLTWVLLLSRSYVLT